MNIQIIDLGINNLRSLQRAVEGMSEDIRCETISSPPSATNLPEILILPGVGNFGTAARVLNSSGLNRYVLDAAQNKIKIIGICLGLQLLLKESEESPSQYALGLIPGEIKKLQVVDDRVPNVGWGEVSFTHESRFSRNLPNESLFYFTHSYFADVKPEFVLATSKHGDRAFPAMISSGSTLGMQFHPEKSGTEGKHILHEAILGSD